MPSPQLPPLQAPRLLDEQAYVHWVRAFVRFRRMRHPRKMGQPEVEAFLSWLAAERQVRAQWLADVQADRAGVVSTTMIYTHVLKVGGGAVRSPLDALQPA
jgi:hypothetical protein